MRESKGRLILDFVEGFALTWNPFTMALSVAVSFIEAIIMKFKTTPRRNASYLLGALVGTFCSYYTDGTWFMEWNGIWWMPAGLIVASVLGILLSQYSERREQ
ncbi:hypothetical protein [Thermococcus sp.]|uniref:hypothetical protein n=1 Tax=Thermococcus sp. TaxID=35749 RepID=UPI002611FD8F|nr:hypothetical protein [Thermococcus sp.]